VNNHFFNDSDDDSDIIPQAAQSRLNRRQRRPRRQQKPPAAIIETLCEVPDVLEGALEISYQPSRHEAEWLMSSITDFFEQGLIADVLSHIQGGKEASVYCCVAGPNVDADLIAVKIYRPRKHRSLSNDSLYREGRETLSEEGRTIKQTDHRVMRAIAKRTGFGEQVRHQSWLMYEFNALQKLYSAGACVPRPWAATHNAIAMEYIGTDTSPAPTLARIKLPAEEATVLLEEVLDTIDFMLQQGLIHGDLSPYNILYQDGKVTVIDFPQIVRVGVNSHSEALFARDVRRVCSYFSRQGAPCDAEAIIEELWTRYTITHEQLIEPL
jgi:RIO kinase 1